MDQVDRRLLALVQSDGRIGYAELAQRVGLATSSVHDRMRRLQAAGTVCYVGLVDAVAVGLTVVAFVTVLVGHSEQDRFLTDVRANQQVLECHRITGPWSHLLKVRASDNADLEVLLDRVRAHDGVARVQTLLALSTEKETLAVPTGG